MKTIQLKPDIYSRIEAEIRNSDFSSVDEYVNFLLEEVLRDEEKKQTSESEAKAVEESLKKLGYM